MIRFFRRVFKNIRQRRFLAEYGLVLALLLVVILQFFDDLLDAKFIMNLIMGALVVLILDITERNQGERGLDAYLHTRDELGIFATTKARPIQAAFDVRCCVYPRRGNAHCHGLDCS